MEQLFGTSTLTLAVIMVIIALPSQIRKNYRDRKCGLSFLMTLLPFGVYASRTCYAATIKSWYIFIPDCFGVIFAAILMFQYFLYRK